MSSELSIFFIPFFFIRIFVFCIFSQEEKVTYPHHQNDYSLILLKQFHILFLNLRNRASILVSIMK